MTEYKHIKRLALLGAAVLILATGCGRAEPEVSEPAADISTEEEKNTKTLEFVDAHGQSHEMQINPDVPGNIFDNSNYTRDGQKLIYEDDDHYSRQGIDVSYHQGDIDWSAVKKDGYDFVFIRIGYRGYGESGSLNPDEKFDEYIKGAKEAGLDVGVYFFSQAINEDEVKEEAGFVIDKLSGYELDLPVVFDPERILDDDARTDAITGDQFSANTMVFCEAIENAGYEAMVYSNMVWEAFEFDMPKVSKYPIWYADYEEVPQTPYKYEFLQYSESGTVDGIAGTADLDLQILRK